MVDIQWWATLRSQPIEQPRPIGGLMAMELTAVDPKNLNRVVMPALHTGGSSPVALMCEIWEGVHRWTRYRATVEGAGHV